MMMLQTILGHYGDKASEAWAWLLPTIIPTLSLIIGTFVADTLGKSIQINIVDRFLYRLTSALSLAYLITVSLTILLSPFSIAAPLEIMKMSSFWLGPLQGLVGTAIGIFFVSKGAK